MPKPDPYYRVKYEPGRGRYAERPWLVLEERRGRGPRIIARVTDRETAMKMVKDLYKTGYAGRH